MNCSQTHLKLESYLSRSLAEGEFREVRGHLESCPACRQVYSEELQFNSLVKKAFDEQTFALQPLREAVRSSLTTPTPSSMRRPARFWVPWAIACSFTFAILFGAWASIQYVQNEPLRLIINHHIAHELPELESNSLDWQTSPESIQSLLQSEKIPDFYLSLLPPETAEINKAALCRIGQDQWVQVWYEWETHPCSFLIRSLPQISPEFLQACPAERGRKNYRYRNHNLFTFSHRIHQIVLINDLDRELSDSLANQSQLRLLYQAPRPLALNAPQ